jgi:myo-inositol-1(or 4)-monophosphatase
MLDQSTLHQISREVQAIAELAGKYIQSEFGKIGLTQASEKSAKSLVSEVDRTAERMLVAQLSELLPLAGFLTEEETITQVKRSLTWVVDPLDGTTNFLYGVPYFAVSIALCSETETLIGVVRDVVHEKTYHAIQGGGCYCDGNAIQVSKRSKLNEALIATGFPYTYTADTEAQIEALKRLVRECNGIRRFGSAALDLAMVAEGTWDAYYEYALNPWDTAAGMLLVREAGGVCSDRAGNIDYKAGTEIVASNPVLFEEFLTVLHGFS